MGKGEILSLLFDLWARPNLGASQDRHIYQAKYTQKKEKNFRLLLPPDIFALSISKITQFFGLNSTDNDNSNRKMIQYF